MHSFFAETEKKEKALNLLKNELENKQINRDFVLEDSDCEKYKNDTDFENIIIFSNVKIK